MLVALFAVALQSVPLPAGYTTQITVGAHDNLCVAAFVKGDGTTGYSVELPMQGVAEEFDALISANADAQAEAELSPVQAWGKANAGAIEQACARSAGTGGGTVIAVR